MASGWPSREAEIRYCITEGFRVFNGQCANCGWQTVVVCWPDRIHDLACENCKKFTMEPYEELTWAL
jgi:hypothetical protein